MTMWAKTANKVMQDPSVGTDRQAGASSEAALYYEAGALVCAQVFPIRVGILRIKVIPSKDRTCCGV